MKKIATCFFIISILLLTSISVMHAQGILDRLKQKAKDKVNDRVDQKTDKAMDKALDSTEAATKNKKTNNSADTKNNSSTNTANNTQNENTTTLPGIKSYANYDFIPGDKIIFQSQLVDEQVGEIPSQFNLSHGQMDVQLEDGENVIHVPKGEGATITPRMKNQASMPDQFTIEFDFKNEGFGIGHLMVDFGSRVYYAATEGVMPGMTFGTDNSMDWTLGDVTFPQGLDINYNHPMQWHHVAIAVNKTTGKVYIDQYRVTSVNNLSGKANNVTIDVSGYENSYIKNVRIASGGIDIYKKVTTDTKIVTHGILFDVDKATLRPESMGTLNGIYNILKKDPSLKFEIDGYTDNSGTAPHNLTLSQQRADAVKDQLIKMGIEDSRLAAKGFGDTKPMDTNNTPEGKANNRRVEFVKM